MVTALTVPLLTTNSSATTLTKKVSGANNFKSSWVKNAETSDGYGSVDYGFNTTLINEDYAYGHHMTKKHTAIVSNGGGSFSGPNSGANVASNIEVTHKGTNVSYGIAY